MFIITVVGDRFIRWATFDNDRTTLSTELASSNVSNHVRRIDRIGSIGSVVPETIRPVRCKISMKTSNANNSLRKIGFDGFEDEFNVFVLTIERQIWTGQ